MNMLQAFEASLYTFTPGIQYGDWVDDKHPGGALQLSSLLPAVSSAIGRPITTQIHTNPEVLRQALGLPQVKSAVVVLIDGMGYWNIRHRIGHAPYLRSLFKDSANNRPIYSCSPSTTVVSLSSFGTGTCPGLTCMMGYTQRNSQTNKIAQLIQFRDAPDPEDLQQVPTIFEQLTAQSVRADSVSLAKFEGSALTHACLRGSRYLTGKTPRARMLTAAKTTQKPGLTYVYMCELDKVGHREGWLSDQWVAALEQVDAQLRLLRSHCHKGTLICITADHGMIQSNPATCIDIAQDERLTRDVTMIGGEPRSLMVYVNPKADVQQVYERWSNVLENKALVRTRSEAIASGMFGQVCSRAETIVGDLVVQACGDTTLVDSRIQTPQAMHLPSVHGSMSAMEMHIPCLIDLV